MWALAIATLAVVAGGLVLFTGWMARRAQGMAPPLGDFLELDRSRIHFVDVGPDPACDLGRGPTRDTGTDVGRASDPGRTLVMIHGLGGTMRSFTYSLVDELRGEFRVLALDRPGSGYSTRPDDRADIPHQAQLVARFIAAKGLNRPLVVGHSFGGAVALALALDHPDSVGGLALISPLTHPQETIPQPFRGLKIRWRWLRWVIAWTLAVPVGICRRSAQLEVIFGPDPVPGDFATRGGGMLGMRPRSFYAMSTDLMALGSELRQLASRYPRLTLPVGVLFGAADRILDSHFHGAAMAGKIAGLDLELIESGGHMTPICDPRRSGDFIRRIAARVGSESTLAE